MSARPDSTAPALSLQFSGRAEVEATVDPVAYFGGFGPSARKAYAAWDGEQDEYWDTDCDSWQKPHAWLYAQLLQDVEVGFAAPTKGVRDNSEFNGFDTDEVRYRAGAWMSTREQRRWTQADYDVLVRDVPWLAAASDPDLAAELARTAPIPGDQPLFAAGTEAGR